MCSCLKRIALIFGISLKLYFDICKVKFFKGISSMVTSRLLRSLVSTVSQQPVLINTWVVSVSMKPLCHSSYVRMKSPASCPTHVLKALLLSTLSLRWLSDDFNEHIQFEARWIILSFLVQIKSAGNSIIASVYLRWNKYIPFGVPGVFLGVQKCCFNYLFIL